MHSNALFGSASDEDGVGAVDISTVAVARRAQHPPILLTGIIRDYFLTQVGTNCCVCVLPFCFDPFSTCLNRLSLAASSETQQDRYGTCHRGTSKVTIPSASHSAPLKHGWTGSSRPAPYDSKHGWTGSSRLAPYDSLVPSARQYTSARLDVT